MAMIAMIVEAAIRHLKRPRALGDSSRKLVMMAMIAMIVETATSHHQPPPATSHSLLIIVSLLNTADAADALTR